MGENLSPLAYPEILILFGGLALAKGMSTTGIVALITDGIANDTT